MITNFREFALAFAVLLVGVSDVFGYGTFRAQVPNAERVAHPCKTNYMWKAIGHTNQLGGGDRNPFGVDFAKADFKVGVKCCGMGQVMPRSHRACDGIRWSTTSHDGSVLMMTQHQST